MRWPCWTTLGVERARWWSAGAAPARSSSSAAEHPERVTGLVLIAPDLPLSTEPAERGGAILVRRRAGRPPDGWAKWNRHYWLRDWPGFLEFFFAQAFTEPHSTKQIEDAIGWGLETDPRDHRSAAWTPSGAMTGSTRAAAVRSGALPGAGHPGHRRTRSSARPAAPRWPPPSRARGWSRWRAPATRRTCATRSGTNLVIRDFVLPAAAAAALGARPRAPQAGAVHLLADRARPRPARRRHRRRAAQAASRTWRSTGWPSTRSPRVLDARGERVHPASALPGQRVGAHRVRVGRARPARLPGHPADGRDPAGQLHGLPRPGPRRATTTCGSATRPGTSTTTCTRTRS